MKRILCKAAAFLLAVSLLTGCGAAESVAAPNTSSQIASVPTASPAPATEGAEALRLAPQWPEYYGYTVEQLPNVPDFLTEDQQALFKAAVRLYDGLYGCSPGYLPQWTDTVSGGDSAGRYALDEGFASYADFEKALHAVFTDAFCKELLNTLRTEQYPRLKEYEGRLYALEADRGSNIEYVSTRYELKNQSEDVIEFDMIALYNPGAPAFDNPAETRDATKDRTESFPIRMERTEAGWRFASFAKEN